MRESDNCPRTFAPYFISEKACKSNFTRGIRHSEIFGVQSALQSKIGRSFGLHSGLALGIGLTLCISIQNRPEFRIAPLQIVLDLPLQWSPLVWSTDVRSIRLYGQFLASPERIGHFVSEKAGFKVKKTSCKVKISVKKFIHSSFRYVLFKKSVNLRPKHRLGLLQVPEHCPRQF